MSIISADFSGVDVTALALVKRAEGIRDDLEAFHKSVEQFQQNEMKGASNDAWTELQGLWAQSAFSMNETLQGAGMLVRKGNSELQDLDGAMSGLFKG